MVEALRVRLTALVEATESGDVADRASVLFLPGHRAAMTERMRRRVPREDPDMPPKAQEALLLDAPATGAETAAAAAA